MNGIAKNSSSLSKYIDFNDDYLSKIRQNKLDLSLLESIIKEATGYQALDYTFRSHSYRSPLWGDREYKAHLFDWLPEIKQLLDVELKDNPLKIVRFHYISDSGQKTAIIWER